MPEIPSSKDLVNRLRSGESELQDEAADEIERLRKALERIALEPLGDPETGPNELLYNIERIAKQTLGIPAEQSKAVETRLPHPDSYQARVFAWELECFGRDDATNQRMRMHRFFEEACELMQALGCLPGEACRILDYVYRRPAGVGAQEVGGTMVSLAALCEAFGIDMQQAGETELTRILRAIDQIRARHAAKPDFAENGSQPRHTWHRSRDGFRCSTCTAWVLTEDGKALAPPCDRSDAPPAPPKV